MKYINNESIRKNYFLIILPLLVFVSTFSPIVKSQSQSQYSGSTETDKYNFEYQITNLNIPFKNIFALFIIKENKSENDSLASVPDTIKLVLYLEGYHPSGNNSMWGKFLNKGKQQYIPPFQIYIKGTNGYFKVDKILANYEYINFSTKELYMSPIVTNNKDRETVVITNNPKFAIEDAVELFIKARWDQ